MLITTTRGALASALAAALMLAPLTAWAGAVVARYFGEDLNGGNPARSRPNANAAYGAFIDRVPRALADDFELDTLLLPTPQGGELKISDVVSDADGRFALSGRRYALLTSSTAPEASFLLDIPFPATAFGFFGIDIGDFNERLALRLEFDDGGFEDVFVPHTRDSRRANGAVFFQGVITDSPIAGIRFANLNPVGGTASLAFDDVVVGRAIDAPVPTAATLPLLAPATLGLFALRRRRRTV